MIAPMPPPNAVIPYTVPTKRGATMSPGIVWVVVAQLPCPKVARPMNRTNPSGVGATIAGRLAAIETALISMTTFRARSSVHPCFMRRGDRQNQPFFQKERPSDSLPRCHAGLLSTVCQDVAAFPVAHSRTSLDRRVILEPERRPHQAGAGHQNEGRAPSEGDDERGGDHRRQDGADRRPALKEADGGRAFL